jgi:hypothetical protein
MRLKNNGGQVRLACSGGGELCHDLDVPSGTEKYKAWSNAMEKCRGQVKLVEPLCGLCIFCMIKRLWALLQVKYQGVTLTLTLTLILTLTLTLTLILPDDGCTGSWFTPSQGSR